MNFMLSIVEGIEPRAKIEAMLAAQMAALEEYRSNGERCMIVQHLNVSDGGQAIDGALKSPSEGGAAVQNMEFNPNAPGVAMPRQIEAEREPAPSATGAGP